METIRRAEKILERLNELGKISENKSCLTRRFGTPAFIQGSQLVESWMKEAGLITFRDNIGNIRGKLSCRDPASKTFVLGSHIDTVADAGKFDGPLGVIMAIDFLEQAGKTNRSFPFHLECIAFSDEEGVRFHTTFLGSKAITGTFKQELLLKTDQDSITLETVLKEMDCDPKAVNDHYLSSVNVIGYFEIHIEQGPVLFNNGIPVAVVRGIAAQKRIMLTLSGMAGHAGTVPMSLRKDALCAASECIVAIEQYANSDQTSFVATVGKLEVHNSASNVIPGKVSLTLDLRSIDLKDLNANAKSIEAIINKICMRRSINLDWELIQQTEPTICDELLNEKMKLAIINNGLEPIEIVSGAGHDAVEISKIAPVCMLFVKCFEGISHNPLENVEIKDIAAAIKVAEEFIKLISETY